MIISLLLKKALPFALTFVVGTALGGLTWLFGGSEKQSETALVTRTYDFGRRCGNARRRHKLVAETRALSINFKPDARRPLGAEAEGARSAIAQVTFGADGEIEDVKPLRLKSQRRGDSLAGLKTTWESVERAARQIEFTPETVDGRPVTVTRDVEIYFLND